MKNKWSLLFVVALLAVLFSGCGIINYTPEDKAIVGGGAVAGKDYVCGLEPSRDARDYFSSISEDEQPIETVRRSDGRESRTGVKFVNNGGILIPPGVTISFENSGYCLDPNLPAPKAGEEFQLIPMGRLIPDELQGTYKKLIMNASAGNSAVISNMQHLVWALRTAGTEAAYSNNLTSQQRQILNNLSDGQFELFHLRNKSTNKLINDLLNMADSVLNVKIGGVIYKASDLLDPNIANKKIEEHLNQLIEMSEFLPVENTGFNYGEIQPGIYTDVHGSGYLSYHAKIANSTNQPYIFYPSDWVGQVGSPGVSSGFFAAADSSMRQRVTGGSQIEVKVEDQSEPKTEADSPSCPPHNLVAFRSADYFNHDALKKLNNTIRNLSQSQIDRLIELNREKGEEAKNMGLQEDKEFAWKIYITKNGEIKATELLKGVLSSVYIDNLQVPDGATVLASGHSHGRAKDSWQRVDIGSYSLSASDFLAAHQTGCLIYLCDPKGRMHVYNPLTGEYSFDNKGGVIKRFWNGVGDIEKFEDEQYDAFKNGNKRCTKCHRFFKE